MLKVKVLLVTFVGAISLALAACGSIKVQNVKQEDSEYPDSTGDKLYTYIQNNLDYTITDLRVVQEDNGYHVVINVPGTPDMLQDLCIDSISCINGYENTDNTPIAKINPIILSDNGAYFGWSTDGTLYSDKTFPIADNVDTVDITKILSDKIDMSVYSVPNESDLAPVADEDIKWNVISSQDYVRDGKECIGYRIYINTVNASNQQYKDIFENLTDDEKYLHTVWFYFTESAANGSDAADVTMEQTVSGITPLPSK